MAHSTNHATFSSQGNRGLEVGQVEGSSINFHQHLAPERAETPPHPALLIPFERDVDFVDRGAILTHIAEHCSVPGSRTALVGLGGVGKSQLAIEYAYRVREQSADTWVLWVHASSSARFEQSYRDIADKARIVGRRDPQANIFKLVHDWMQDERRKWILILDNVDDSGFFRDAVQDQPGRNAATVARPLQDYLPQCPNGSILITSRSQQAALKLVNRRRMIEIGPMSQGDAVELFRKKLGSPSDDGDVSALAAALEYMPLAIIQAAAYIVQRAPRCSVQEYLAKFQRSDRQKTSLLDYEGGELRRDPEAQNSIIMTWQISFDYIRQTQASAADLLSLMSFFDRQGIPETLLRYRAEPHGAKQKGEPKEDDELADGEDEENDDDSEAESEMNERFEEDIQMLRNYSFISVGADRESFEMHRLVQLATRKWLEAQGQLERWKQQFIKNLCQVMPTGEFKNWKVCRALFPHAKAASMQQPEGNESLQCWVEILYNAALYARSIGSWAEAAEIATKLMKASEKAFGKEDKNTLYSMAMLGAVYWLQGRWNKAEELQVQVMEMRRRVLGDEHPDTLYSKANLAVTYTDQGRWNEAEELYVQVIETRKRILGDEHPDTLASIANLAATYIYQGRWTEAEELEVKVIEIRKRVLGDEHPDTLTSIANLASTYRCQGRWTEAEELEVQVLETCKRVLGDEHPDTLTSIANLAVTYKDQGRWIEAEQLEVQVVETRKRTLGDEHPDTLNSMNNLAYIWKAQGKVLEAIALMEECVRLSMQVLGATHPRTVSSSKALLRWRADQDR